MFKPTNQSQLRCSNLNVTILCYVCEDQRQLLILYPALQYFPILHTDKAIC